MWTLTLRTPGEKPCVFQVKKTRMTLGRREDADILLSEKSASRLHAEITYDPRGEYLSVHDLGSTNGTYVNSERLLEPRLLKHNDLIRIGGDLIQVSYHVTNEPLSAHFLGTQPLTRALLLESIDQHAVLLYEISRRLNTVLDLETALGEVAELMQVAIGADKCELILAQDFDQLTERGFPTTIAHMAINQRASIIIPDVGAQAEKLGHSALLLRVRSALCVPVTSGDEVIALLYVYKTNPQEPPLDQRDLQLGVAISHQAALTIQRMQLLKRVQEEQRARQLLQRFVSPAETNFILQGYLSSGKLPELQEMTLTILFADIVDSTGLAERIGPKRFGALLQRYYEDMTQIVFDHRGLVDKYMGDGMMAVFGMTGMAPDPEGRAVQAGIKMLEQIEIINRSEPDQITIGVGINTGVVMAGYVGTAERVELTVLGDTVNVASGLQAVARPNRLVVGPATVASIVGRYTMRRVGAINVKGRLRELQAYEVLRDPLASQPPD